MNKLKTFVSGVLATALLCAGTAALSSCGGGDNVYTIEKTCTAIEDIPSDAVNYVMFAYGDNPVINFKTTLTLDDEAKTYTLYKLMSTPETEINGEMTMTFKGEYEYNGTYTVDSSDSNKIILSVPSSGKYNCFYPTVLNYQSVEKQTQDWVSSEEYPLLLTRFNNWYPAKNASTVEQPVTLSGKTMTFDKVDTSVPETPKGDDEENKTESPDTPSIADENALISAELDGSKVIDLYADGSFKFRYPAYSIVEEGTWTWVSHKLTLTINDGDSFVASFNASYNLELEYTSKTTSMIKGTFVFENWGDALGVGGTYTPAE